MSKIYEPSEQEVRLLVNELRGIWKRYEGNFVTDEDALASIERLLYRTGVMQED